MKKSLAPSRSVTARDPKGTKFVSIVEAAYNKAGLSEEEAQRVNDTPGLADLVGTFIADNRLTDKFKDEEVRSSYAYPNGYKVKGITEQTNILRQLFPGVGFADEKLAERPVPTNAEGWFAIPKWETMAATYGEAVEKVLAMIASKRKFYNHCDGQLGAEYLRRHRKTVKMFQTLAGQQKDHDILVVAAQFGLRHRGRSVRRAREVMQVNEYGLGAFAGGIMLLTHPERLMNYNDLYVDCAGDEYSPGADGDFSYAPLFRFDDGRVGFSAYWFDDAYGHCGSASAFLPQ